MFVYGLYPMKVLCCNECIHFFLSFCKGQREGRLLPFTKETMLLNMMCIHLQREAKCTFSFIPTLIFLLSFHMPMSFAANASPENIEDALLRLKQSFNNSTMLSSWDPSQPPCIGNMNNWVGIICSRGGSVYGVRLENMGLSGRIDLDALSVLPRLRSISFMYNEFVGPMPDISRIKALKSVYLSNNRFEGAIDPNKFDGMNRLKKVHLANNRFTGEIPLPLAMLPNLVELRLEGNHFHGPIPNFRQTSFNDLSLANNQLVGSIPNTLSDIRADAFTGNKGLCGMPLDPCSSPQTSPPNQTLPPDSPPFPSKKTIPVIPILIATAVILLVALFASVLIIVRKKSPKKDNKLQGQRSGQPPKNPNGDLEKGHNNINSGKTKGEAGKLCFMRDDGVRFELPDLLKSSAEILGSGCFGSSYKASLGSSSCSPSSMMVVKRFKQMNNVGREEFQEHMRRLGRLQHHNLISIVAYHYRKEEKLLVSKYAHNGSLAAHLHGNQRGQLTLDWPTRLKVIKGIARGLSYLYKELPSLIAPHGHLKSSNVLLDKSFNPSLNDYGLIPLISQESSQQLMVVYKSPEYVENSRINKKTDVWSLGILIIEIITGEFPSAYLQQGSRRVDMSIWVKEVVGDLDDRRVRVFDKNMGLTKNCEDDILKMLRIGLSCCESKVERRLDIKEACERIEAVRERELHYDDDFYSPHASEGEAGSSSREMSDDEYIIVPMA